MPAQRLFRIVSGLFLVNALINWTISLPGIVSPSLAAQLFGGIEPNQPSVLRLWQCFVFMFGALFFEVARDVPGKAALIKYNWIEKTITASVLTAGFAAGDVPRRLLVTIVLTNWLWIPVLLWADLAVRRALRDRAAAA